MVPKEMRDGKRAKRIAEAVWWSEEGRKGDLQVLEQYALCVSKGVSDGAIKLGHLQ